MTAAAKENPKDIKMASIFIETISKSQIEKIEDSFKHCPESLVVSLSNSSDEAIEKQSKKAEENKQPKLKEKEENKNENGNKIRD